MTARRPVQLAALRGRDLIRDESDGTESFSLRVPRAKQRGLRFRGEFRTLAIIEDLYLVLQQSHRRSIGLASKAVGHAIHPELAAEIPIFTNQDRLAELTSVRELERLLMGNAPDQLHATTSPSHRPCSVVRGRRQLARNGPVSSSVYPQLASGIHEEQSSVETGSVLS